MDQLEQRRAPARVLENCARSPIFYQRPARESPWRRLERKSPFLTRSGRRSLHARAPRSSDRVGTSRPPSRALGTARLVRLPSRSSSRPARPKQGVSGHQIRTSAPVIFSAREERWARRWRSEPPAGHQRRGLPPPLLPERMPRQQAGARRRRKVRTGRRSHPEHGSAPPNVTLSPNSDPFHRTRARVA